MCICHVLKILFSLWNEIGIEPQSIIVSKAENITKLKIDGSLSNIKDNLKSSYKIDEYIEKIKKEINELKPIKYIKSVNKISAFAASSFQNSK